MTNFSAYRATGLMITDSAQWEQYKAWAASRTCACGKKASDRTRTEPWATEEECMDCFRKRADAQVTLANRATEIIVQAAICFVRDAKFTTDHVPTMRMMEALKEAVANLQRNRTST